MSKKGLPLLFMTVILMLAFMVTTGLTMLSCSENQNTADDTSEAVMTTNDETEQSSGANSDASSETEYDTTSSDESATADEEITTAADAGIPQPSDGYMLLFDAGAINSFTKVSGIDRSLENPDGGKYVRIVTTANSAYIQPITKTVTESGRYLTVCYRTTASGTGLLHFTADDKTLSTNHGQTVEYQSDGQWHTVTLDLFDNLNYSGDIFKFLCYQPITEAEREIDLAWIAMYKNDGAAYVCKQDFGEPLADCPNLTEYISLPDGGYVQASGYKSENNGTYTFRKGLAFNVYYSENFNRYSIKYTSDSYLTGKITYILDKEEHSETFYLEPGESVIFNSLLDSYLQNKYACKIVSLTFDACKDKDAKLKLEGISSDKVRVFAGGTYYISSDRYTVGVYLGWGGGISYIEDKNDGDEKITSLINSHDTGRLIQQSYYGVSTSAYHTASYNGSVWSYNPVQGGDQYGNVSKIIDFRISDDGREIYIKAQPMDWAQKNMICPAYMENTYIVGNDSIYVNNRFVDWFGQDGGARHQELPAFYTISYLKNFVYYNGTKPWTGDDYITLENQPFWGGNGDCYHSIKSGNTETWAAWVNDKGYGIGLYVPGAEIMLAGRFEFIGNGTKDYKANATNYVAPLRTFTLKSYNPFEYHYIIAAGTVEQMREAFKK